MTDTPKAKHNKDASSNPQENSNISSPEPQGRVSRWFWKAVETADQYSNLIIAIATVFMAVLTVILAITAYRQADVAMRALELTARPYISLSLYPQSVVTQTGQKLRIEISFTNLGGTPADTRINGIIIHSVTKLPAPTLAAATEHRELKFPKEPRESALFIYSPDRITEGQFRDMMAGTGYLYVRVLATYGIYHTEICDEYKLIPSATGKAITFDRADIHRCDDPDSESAN